MVIGGARLIVARGSGGGMTIGVVRGGGGGGSGVGAQGGAGPAAVMGEGLPGYVGQGRHVGGQGGPGGREAGLLGLGARAGAALGGGVRARDQAGPGVSRGLTVCRHVAAPTGARSLYPIRPALHLEIVSRIHGVIVSAPITPRHPVCMTHVTLSSAAAARATAPQGGKVSVDIIANHSLSACLPLLCLCVTL